MGDHVLSGRIFTGFSILLSAKQHVLQGTPGEPLILRTKFLL